MLRKTAKRGEKHNSKKYQKTLLAKMWRRATKTVLQIKKMVSQKLF